MTPAELAALHAQVFITPKPFSEAAFTELLASQGSFLVTAAQGFALGRALVGEAELLTLAVAPDAQRQGVGRQLLEQFERQAALREATRTFLEVAKANTAAQALYFSEGYAQCGLRAGYYREPSGARIDALVLEKALVF